MEICGVHSPAMAALHSRTNNPTKFSALRRPFSSHEPSFSKPLISPQRVPISLQIPPLLSPIGAQMPPKLLSLRPSFGGSQTVKLLAGFGLAFGLAVSIQGIGCGAASAVEFPFLGGSLIELNEPQNALSLPTWAIHVSSVVEWITAMVLVWQYGEKSGFESWKGLSWGMVPLLGGAFCACTWHFFYNAESLSVLVALQAALTVIGNFTMCIAAFRIYKSTQGGPEKS